MRELLRGLPVFSGDLPLFDPAAADRDPAAEFAAWLSAAVAAGVPEPHAMTVSTADEQGRPSARVLILKNVDRDGWQFASGAESRKGRELAANPWAALTFYWPQQGRQVRVRGQVRPLPAEAGARDFLARAPESRAEALLGRQSEVLSEGVDIAMETKVALERIERDPDTIAPGWTLYALVADEVEFWQAAGSRQHTRLRYVRDGADWRTEQLWP